MTSSSRFLTIPLRIKPGEGNYKVNIPGRLSLKENAEIGIVDFFASPKKHPGTFNIKFLIAYKTEPKDVNADLAMFNSKAIKKVSSEKNFIFYKIKPRGEDMKPHKFVYTGYSGLGDFLNFYNSICETLFQDVSTKIRLYLENDHVNISAGSTKQNGWIFPLFPPAIEKKLGLDNYLTDPYFQFQTLYGNEEPDHSFLFDHMILGCDLCHDVVYGEKFSNCIQTLYLDPRDRSTWINYSTPQFHKIQFREFEELTISLKTSENEPHDFNLSQVIIVFQIREKQ